jgi:PAS domain S-box-containing protein
MRLYFKQIETGDTMLESKICLALTDSLRVLSASENISALLGYQANDFLIGNVSLKELIHNHDSDISEMLFSTDNVKRSDTFNIRIRHADGRIRCIRGCYEKYTDNMDGIVKLELTLQDAKSLKRTLDDAVKTPNFRAMMDNTDDFIYFKDRNHVFTGASQTLVALCDPAEHWTDLIGKTDYDVFTEEYADIYYRLEKQVFSGIPVAQEIQKTLAKDGRAGWIDNRKYPINNENGELVGLYGIARDITEQIQNKEKLIFSEKRFRSLFEEMTEGVALHSVIRNESDDIINYRIEMINPAYTSIIGISPEQAVGRLATEVYGTEQAPYLEKYAEVVLSGKPAVFEVFFEPLKKMFSISAIPWEQGGFATIFLDITARRKSEEASTKALDFVKTLLDSSPMGIRVFEGDSGRCVLANQSAADIAGGCIDEMINQNYRTMVSWQQSGLTEVAEQVMSDGKARPIETEMVTTFGKPVAARYFLSKFFVEGKSHLLVIGRDATEEKRLEEQKKQIESQMLHMQKLESLGVLAGGIAHDFNNILMAILGNADLALLTTSSVPAAGNYIHEIKHAARRAADLAHQMLAYSGKGNFLIETLDINRAICEITSLLDVSISKRATLNLDLAQNPPCINADSAQFCQIIMNLVINASEAIEDNNGEITIATGTMDCERTFFAKAWIDDNLPDGRYVYIKVSDTGCGMSPETQSKLFEPFFTTKFTGRGLGMSAVLGIIRGHKGTIIVESEAGKGSTFTVLLPAVDCQDDSSGYGLPQLAAVAKPGGTILLVDDEEIIRQMVGTMLEMFGFKVLLAADGLAALDLYRLHSSEIDCVLLDLTMPKMDGEQTLFQLRQLNPQLRVIMSSGFGEQDISDKLLSKGVAAFIQKPYQMQQLEETIRRVLTVPA